MALIVLAGCAGNPDSRTDDLKRADAYARVGEWDNAITYYQRVIRDKPDDREARSGLARAQVMASQMHRVEGERLARAGDLQRAQLELSLAVRLDETNIQAADALEDVERQLDEYQTARAEARTAIERAADRANGAESPIPGLQHVALGKMTFDYRNARIQQIYKAIGDIGGINVLFDPDMRDDQTTFYLEQVEYEQAIEVLTAMQGHFFRVMSPNTILIAEDSQQKRRQYSPQVMRTFYLSNAESEQVAATLQTILGARQVMPDPSLNAVTIRDTAELVEVAESMIIKLDKARGEVLLQIEIFEMDRTVMEDYGMSLSDYGTTLAINQSDGSGDTPAGISLADLGRLSTNDAFITIPSVRYQFLQQDGSFQLIAQPQLRASDGQASALLIGEERPIVNTTFNPQNTSGGDVIPIATTEYRPVGIEIQATPRVHHDGMITLQLAISISAVQEDAGALEQPVFTTRRLNTTLRLLEGETNLLAGLLRDDERVSYKGVPIVSDIPILRDLFGSTERDVLSTDIVLSITPYIVRMADIDEPDMQAVFIGTENNISGGGRSRGGRNRNNNDDDEGGITDELEIDEPILLSVQPGETFAAVGDRLSVDVSANGAAGINNAGLRVTWNPQVLRLVEASEGSLLGSDGSRTSFTSNQAGQGTVAMGIGRVGDVGEVDAIGVLAALQFEVIGTGESQITVASASLRNQSGRPMPVDFEQGNVIVER